MKHLQTIILGSILAGGILSSCDSVSEPDRFIPAEIDPQRSILVEEYTGQNCVNCPDGHAAIKEIVASLGDSVVPVSIHASSLAIAAPSGLKIEAGETYYKDAGSPALPAAVINMQTSPLQIPAWGEAINKLIMTPTPFTVRPHATIDGDNYKIDVAFSAGEDYEGSLLVWVLENDVVARQLDGPNLVKDYVHNHVLRAVVNGQWGEEVKLNAHVAQHREYTFALDPAWNKNNLYVVAFLYNQTGVAQVHATSQSAH